MAKRTMVIGLDGVPHWLLRQFADDGTMPHVASLLGQGSLRPLRAPLPDISSTSWATFLTGANPGSHGIFGFTDLETGSYDTFFPNLTDLAAPPFWEAVQTHGLKSLIVNVPSTYPAPPISGAVISGFVAPDFSRAVNPAKLQPLLNSLEYELDVEVGDVEADPKAFIDRAKRCLNSRSRAFGSLLHRIDWNLAVCVVTETDRIHHFLWDSLMDSASPLHPNLIGFYRLVDQVIRELDEISGPDTDLMLVSDHGFGPVDTQVSINSFLRQQGFLSLSHEARSLHEIGPDSIAFALDPARIYLNDLERFPHGRSFTRSERQSVLTQLKESLRDFRLMRKGESQPVIFRTYQAKEIYSGGKLPVAADLLAVPNPGFQLRGTLTEPNLTMQSPLTGTHTPHDALFWQRGEFNKGNVDMIDVAPTILASLGIPVPKTMEGQPQVDKQSQ